MSSRINTSDEERSARRGRKEETGVTVNAPVASEMRKRAGGDATEVMLAAVAMVAASVLRSARNMPAPGPPSSVHA